MHVRSEEPPPKLDLGEQSAIEAEVEDVGLIDDNVGEVGAGEAQVLQSLELGGQGLVQVEVEKSGELGDELPDLGLVETVRSQETQDGVWFLGGLEVCEVFGGLGCLVRGEPT